jgi:hypothetical protein
MPNVPLHGFDKMAARAHYISYLPIIFLFLIIAIPTAMGDPGLNICKFRECNRGFYQKVPAQTCSQCPAFDTGVGAYTSVTTAAAGMTSITQCYVPAGVEYFDAAGAFVFSTNCFYAD